jgi:hypothetical protein
MSDPIPLQKILPLTLPSFYPPRADHPRYIVTAAPGEVAMQSTVRPAISARVIASTGGRSRGERTGFGIVAKTMPMPDGRRR